MAQRLSKLERQPTALSHKRITDRSLEIIATIARYRFIPTSLLVRLIEGNERVTQRHLQQLFHKGLINRFSFPQAGTLGEFFYYLDNTKSLELLIQHELACKEELDWGGVRRNQEKAYSAINDPNKSAEAMGRLLFLQHEAMISRFHFMLEMGCRKSKGKVELAQWRQGAELHNTVVDLGSGEILPHRPDAFFTLRFPGDPEGQNRANFFYEADRKTTSTPRFIKKLQAHHEFIVRQRKHEECYGIRRIRAVLIETLDTKWAEELRQAAVQVCRDPLFWFTASEIFTRERQIANGNRDQTLPGFLLRPEIVFGKVWVSAIDDRLQSLLI